MEAEGSTIAQKYAAAAAAAANHSAAWILADDQQQDTRVISFRSVRNIDTDAAESYVQWHSASPSTSAISTMTPPFPVSLFLTHRLLAASVDV